MVPPDPHSHGHSHDHAPQPWPGLAASGAGGAVVDPAHDRGLPARCGARGQRRAVGHGLAGDEVIMSAQLQFRDVTLGYDRHPAVHHLDGEVASGALLAVVGPNGAGKSTLFRGLVGILKPLGGLDSDRRSRRQGYRLSAADGGHRPQLSDLGVRFRRHRAVALDRLFRRHGQGRARQDRAGARGRRPQRVSKTAPSARCPAGRCSACCLRGCCCRTPA